MTYHSGAIETMVSARFHRLYARKAFCVAGGCCPRRSVVFSPILHSTGLLEESFDACEDYEFNHRADLAGLRCYFTPEVAVRYVPRGSLLSLFRQMIRYGRGRIHLLRKHPGSASISTFIPAAFVLGLAVGLPLSFTSSWLAAAYLVPLLAYSGIVLLVSVEVLLQRGNLSLLAWLPLVFATVHVGAVVQSASKTCFLLPPRAIR